MTDTVPTIPSFDPDAIHEQAKAQIAACDAEIERQKQIRADASARIRDLNEAKAKALRIVSAFIPRTRKTEETSAKKAPAAKKAASAKKAAPAAADVQPEG